jgi:hypothetical protein
MADLCAAVQTYFDVIEGFLNSTKTAEDVNRIKTEDCRFQLAPAALVAQFPLPPDFGTNASWAEHIKNQQPVVASSDVEVLEIIVDEKARKATAHVLNHIKLKNGKQAAIENAVFLHFDQETDRLKKIIDFADSEATKTYMGILQESMQAQGQPVVSDGERKA